MQAIRTSRQALHRKVLLINHVSIAAVGVHDGDVAVVIQRDQPAIGQPTHIDLTVVVHLLGVELPLASKLMVYTPLSGVF